jgi:hypothetical protein
VDRNDFSDIGNLLQCVIYTIKTTCNLGRSNLNFLGVRYTTKLSLGGNNDVITELFLPRGSLVSDIPAGDGKLVNLFFTVYYVVPLFL